MSFLTPLYLLAGLAISLPILFHLIRRTPRGRQVFSSVMFLTPSPPRVTRRSRIEHWLLLLLRGLAICLIAAAFARPFLRAQEQVETASSSGRRIAILIDTSASMRRDGYWETAQQRLRDLRQEFRHDDTVQLMTFDRDVRTLLSFDDWDRLDPASRISTLLEVAGMATPTWQATQLSRAMIDAAEQLDDDTSQAVQERRLVLISDLQSGSDWESLQGYVWPENVVVQLETIKDSEQTAPNASLQVVAEDAAEDDLLRVRVSNSQHAVRELFQLHWRDEFSDESETVDVSTENINIYVPPGQSRIVRAPERPDRGTPQQLVLTGDDEDFDNVCYVARRAAWRVNLVFVGEERQGRAANRTEANREQPNAEAPPTALDPSTSLRFFLNPLFPSSPSREVHVLDWDADSPTPPVEEQRMTLLIVGGTLSQAQTDWIQKWLSKGGQVLFVARDSDQASTLYELVSSAARPVSEAEVNGYSMLQQVDLSHPLLRQFDDPRFADFTKLRFWRHRVFKTGSLPGLKLVAAFDDGAPAIAEIPAGEGRVFLFSSGWNRDDSQLALWSKFVPLMNRLLEYAARRQNVRPQFFVGDELTAADLDADHDTLYLRDPAGAVVELSGPNRHLLDQPGIYRVAATRAELTDETATRFGVNLVPRESQTDVLPVELLEGAGVRLYKTAGDNPRAQDPDQQRQLMNMELESQQQLWRWLIVAALGILLTETVVANWRSRSVPA